MLESFSERYGYIDKKDIQYETLDQGTRNRVLNLIQSKIRDVYDERRLYKYIADKYFKISEKYHDYFYSNLIEKEILEEEWHTVFSFIEFFSLVISKTKSSYNTYSFEKALNDIFVSEKVGYRLSCNIIVPITNEIEIEAINIASSTKYDSVNKHLKKALKLYSDRMQPDYENSIKESISAVESIACIIVENDKAVLASALDRLVNKGVRLHKAQIEAYKKLYGYTSDENGIRHAGIDFKGANAEDAKYMLVSCSAFVYYLIEKYNLIS